MPNHRHFVGKRPLYRDRFKAFPIQTDDHYFTALRTMERNALRANLVERADNWRCGSLWVRENAASTHPKILTAMTRNELRPFVRRRLLCAPSG